MNKSLPLYYLVVLWLMGSVSVYFIIRPLIAPATENDFNNFSVSAKLNGNAGVSRNSNEPPTTPGEINEPASPGNKNSDLVFYDKTAFIRYFSDAFSEEELKDSYEKALAAKKIANENTTIRVTRKAAVEKSKKSFSGSFDIRPVPVNTHQ